MNKLPLLVFVILSLPAFSQTDKGATIVGGSLSLQTTKNNSNFSFNPNIGFFPATNFALGAGLNLNFSKQGDVKMGHNKKFSTEVLKYVKEVPEYFPSYLAKRCWHTAWC